MNTHVFWKNLKTPRTGVVHAARSPKEALCGFRYRTVPPIPTNDPVNCHACHRVMARETRDG